MARKQVRKPAAPTPLARVKPKPRKSDKKTRLLVIGANDKACLAQLPAICSLDQVEIVGLFETSPEWLERARQQFDLPRDICFAARHTGECVEKIEQLEPDGVVTIGNADSLHDLHLWCLANYHNLFTDHPVYMSAHQADLLASLADMNGCVTQVALEHRTNPLLNKMLRACKSHGPVSHAVCEIHDYHPALSSATFSRLYGDTLRAIDTLRWICGDPVHDIDSTCRRIETFEINWTGATLYFENGSMGYLVNNWNSGRRVCHIQIHAPGVCAEIDPESSGRLYVEGDTKGEEYDAKRVAGSEAYHVYTGYQAKCREFVESIRTGKDTTSSSFRDVLSSLDVVETILANAHLDNWDNLERGFPEE